MDNKTKDSVFSILLMLVGAYIVFEGMRIVSVASRPPYRVTEFSISPGMMPVVLGIALIVFSVLLLVNSLRGETGKPSVLWGHIQTSSERIGKAVGEIDVQSMIVSVVIMFLYTFFLLGAVPFWVGAVVFLVAIMLYLRAAKWWIVVSVSAASVFAIVALFEGVFKTTLP